MISLHVMASNPPGSYVAGEAGDTILHVSEGPSVSLNLPPPPKHSSRSTKEFGEH